MTIKIKQRDLSYLWFPDQLFKYAFEYINIVLIRINLIKSPFLAWLLIWKQTQTNL